VGGEHGHFSIDFPFRGSSLGVRGLVRNLAGTYGARDHIVEEAHLTVFDYMP
jgi:hypothetical protein